MTSVNSCLDLAACKTLAHAADHGVGRDTLHRVCGADRRPGPPRVGSPTPDGRRDGPRPVDAIKNLAVCLSVAAVARAVESLPTMQYAATIQKQSGRHEHPPAVGQAGKGDELPPPWADRWRRCRASFPRRGPFLSSTRPRTRRRDWSFSSLYWPGNTHTRAGDEEQRRDRSLIGAA